MNEQVEIPIFDGHNDVLLGLTLREGGDPQSFFKHGESGHLDLPRARSGNLGGGFFAHFVPSRTEVPTDSTGLPSLIPQPDKGGYQVPLAAPVDHANAMSTSMAMMDCLFRLERESQGRVAIVHTAAKLQSCLRDGTFAAILHFEGAEAIDSELHALEVFYRAGLRSLGLVWSRSNAFAHGVPFMFPHSPDTGPGLTQAGKTLVRACNQRHILIDLSHLNEQGFWDVARLSDAPLVATHSNAHALTPSTRNLTDRQLAAIRDSDGMIGVNFAVGFLRADGGNSPDTPLNDIVRHIDYLVERVGIERVGFGSDFNGATIPRELGSAAGLPRLLHVLGAAGYDQPSLRKLAFENWVRVLRATWGE